MADINSVVLVGRLTRDIEVTYSKSSNTPIGKIALAVNRSIKRGDKWESEASFFDVTIIGTRADSLKQYLVKGKQIAVTGELQQDRWEKDGQKFSRVVIIADNIQLLGGNSSENTNSSKTSNGNNNNNYSSGPENIPEQNSYGSEFPEDIPF